MEPTQPSAETRQESKTWADRLIEWVRRSVMLKLLSVAIMVLLLLIPAMFIQDLVRERSGRRNEAVQEVSAKWGEEQTVGGVVLTVPYRYTVAVAQDKTSKLLNLTGYAHFMPDSLVVTTALTTETRARGIFQVPLYQANVNIRAQFQGLTSTLPSLPAGAELAWNEAYIETGVSDIQGIVAADSVVANGKSYRFQPSLPVRDVFPSGIHAPLPVAPEAPLSVQIDLKLKGSETIYFLPYGQISLVRLAANGKTGVPSFDGAFLPDERTVLDTSFTASWQVLDLNRDIPARFVNAPNISVATTNDAAYSAPAYSDKDYYNSYSSVPEPVGTQAAFGVKLLPGQDIYAQTERSAKYCFLFIFLTFLTLFFAEVLGERRVHPIQYLLIGFTIVVFYVVLLALTEHISFGMSYLLAALVITSYVVLYVRSAFERPRLTAMMALIVLTLYGFFYSLLQLEDYALLVGSIGLLVLVGAILYVTRRVDWYSYGLGDGLDGNKRK